LFSFEKPEILPNFFKKRSQIQEKARKKDEEKRKEREYERKEEEKIKKELSELDSRFNCENPSKKTSKQYNELPQNSQIRTSFEKIEAIPDKKDQRKEVSETKEISQIKEIQETYQTKEFYQIKDISFSQTPQNEKRPESKGISFEEPEYFKVKNHLKIFSFTRKLIIIIFIFSLENA